MSARAGRGAIWIYSKTLLVQGIRLVAIAILARELDPRAFGIVALANVALMFVDYMASSGVTQFIIYDRDQNFEERAAAAFWMNIVFSVLALAVGYLTAPTFARFFDEPQLVPVLLLLLLRYPFDAATRVLDAVKNKDLHFSSIEIRDTAVEFGIGAGSIGMALSGCGVWSLVIPAVVLATVRAIAAAWTSRWTPGWRPRLGLWPRIFKYTGHIIGGSLTSFIITHGDSLLVGKLIGSGGLGLYSIAWQTSNLVNKTIVNPSSRLLFPMLTTVADNRERFVATLRRILCIVAGISFPALIGLFVVADDFIHVVYGQQWDAAVLPLRILIVYAIRFAVGSPLGPALKALGRPDVIFTLGLATVPCYCGAIWLGTPYGIVGVAAGVTLVRTGAGLITFIEVARLLKIRTMELVAPMVSSFAAAALMGCLVVGAKWGWGLADDDYTVVKLLAMLAAGVTAYLLSIRYLFRSVAEEFANLFRRLFGERALVLNRLLNVTV